MLIEGKLTFADTVRIDGNFKGEINATGTLVVGEGGVVEGQIRVGSAVITGEIKGTLDASARVEIKSPGRVLGEMHTPNLIIGDGAVFEGTCHMLQRGTANVTESVNYGGV
ncbi:MAG: polymer-forming cytoskeletal protein [Deltaproteobacteria bacterium]|nr:polymer-forming cytoskeletal protein [Deltaproteobacteria bacterium]